MTPEQQQYTQQILATDLATYLFKDYVNLVKQDNFLLESYDFTYFMFLQGRKESVFKDSKEYATNFFARMQDTFNDKAFAQHAARLHFILKTI